MGCYRGHWDVRRKCHPGHSKEVAEKGGYPSPIPNPGDRPTGTKQSIHHVRYRCQCQMVTVTGRVFQCLTWGLIESSSCSSGQEGKEEPKLYCPMAPFLRSIYISSIPVCIVLAYQWCNCLCLQTSLFVLLCQTKTQKLGHTVIVKCQLQLEVYDAHLPTCSRPRLGTVYPASQSHTSDNISKSHN